MDKMKIAGTYVIWDNKLLMNQPVLSRVITGPI